MKVLNRFLSVVPVVAVSMSVQVASARPASPVPALSEKEIAEVNAEVDSLERLQNVIATSILRNDLRSPEGRKVYRAKVAAYRSELEAIHGRKAARQMSRSYLQLMRKLDETDFSALSAQEQEKYREVLDLYVNQEKRNTLFSAVRETLRRRESLPQAERELFHFPSELEKTLRSHASIHSTYVKYARSWKNASSSGRMPTTASRWIDHYEGNHLALVGKMRTTLNDPAFLTTYGPGMGWFMGVAVMICAGKDSGKMVGVTAIGGALLGGGVGLYFGREAGLCMGVFGVTGVGAMAGVSTLDFDAI